MNIINVYIDDDTYNGLYDLGKYYKLVRSDVVEKLVKEHLRTHPDIIESMISPSVSPSPEPTADPEWAARYPPSMLQPGWYGDGPGGGSASPSMTASCSASPYPWYEEIWYIFFKRGKMSLGRKWRLIKVELENAWLDWKEDRKRK